MDQQKDWNAEVYQGSFLAYHHRRQYYQQHPHHYLPSPQMTKPPTPPQFLPQPQNWIAWHISTLKRRSILTLCSVPPWKDSIAWKLVKFFFLCKIGKSQALDGKRYSFTEVLRFASSEACTNINSFGQLSEQYSHYISTIEDFLAIKS